MAVYWLRADHIGSASPAEQLRDQDKTLQKRYVALVAGKWPHYLVDIEAPLEKFQRGGERIVQVTENGKQSHSDLRSRATGWLHTH